MTKLRTYYAQHYDDIMLLSLYCHNLGGLAQLTHIRVACTINEIYNPENNPYSYMVASAAPIIFPIFIMTVHFKADEFVYLYRTI